MFKMRLLVLRCDPSAYQSLHRWHGYFTIDASFYGSKEMFYLTTHTTHFIYGYVASNMVEDHSDSEGGNHRPMCYD